MITLLSLLASLFAQADPVDPAPAEVPEADRGLVVVELFTSQGCPMCPDANALLEELDAYGGVVAIAYGVGWWDMYGWADEFARPEFAERQQAYVEAGEAMRVFTPHFVVNGSPEKMRFSPEAVRAAVVGAPALTFALSAEDGAVRLDGPPRETPARLWRVEYVPGAQTRAIAGGANAGRSMTHFNMAGAITALGDWSGGALSLEVAPPAPGEAAVVLVQDGPGGRLLGAVRLEPAEQADLANEAD
ncbi:MAG: DUF1223 domain-containing protein [Oceanicaulis sp.]